MSSYKADTNVSKRSIFVSKGSRISNEAIYRKLNKGMAKVQTSTWFDKVIDILVVVALFVVTGYLFFRGML